MIFECPPEQFYFNKASIANFVDLREKSLEWEVPRAEEAAILLVAGGLIRIGDVNQADALTKPTAPPGSILSLQSNGRWKIVFDENYVSAKNVRKAKRNAHFKSIDHVTSHQSPAQGRKMCP